MIQVNKDHYNFSNYADKSRWASYWHQIDEVLKTNPSRVLVIGIGDEIVPDIIQRVMPNSEGRVYKFDYDKDLKPDFVGDLRNIDSILTDFKVDCILCSQVLEHVEYEYLDSILRHFASISPNVIISVPHRGKDYNFQVQMNKRKKTISFRIPEYNKYHEFDGEHYWELGTKKSSKKKFIQLLSQYFTIENIYHVPEKTYHIFFILKSKSFSN